MRMFPETLAVLVLAAGASTRFGADDKLLAPLDGKPMSRRVFDLAAGMDAEQKLAVVAGAGVAKLATDARLKVVRVSPRGKQSDSLRAGLTALRPEVASVLILLADMPWVTPEDLVRLLAHGAPACTILDGQRMPPALLPREWYQEMVDLEGDRGARKWLRRIAPEQCLALPASHLRDVDRPDDLPGK